jgi:alkanesulfonate monooxygenase SsuD/methylene tetrahydromethanopterin reductase-like flavin-dependent oxidoreductase (luciferase family)
LSRNSVDRWSPTVANYDHTRTLSGSRLSAKALGSLDLVSGGRLIAGVGAGYLRSEFSAVGVDFDRRAELFDEALGALWSIPTCRSAARISKRLTRCGCRVPHNGRIHRSGSAATARPHCAASSNMAAAGCRSSRLQAWPR